MSDVVPIEVATARRLTERIRLMAVTVSENIDKLKALVDEAKQSKVHEALGYASWTAYLTDVLSETPLRLERDVRRELVAELSEQGMSTRAIAPIVGASFKTVARDLESPVSDDTPPEPTPAAVPDLPVNPQTGEVYEAGDAVHGSPEATVTVTETHSVKTVTGLDGKTYTQSKPKLAPSPDVTEYLDADQSLQDRKYVTAFVRALSADWLQFDAERIAAIADADVIKQLELTSASVARFAEAVKRNRPGLRAL